MASDSNADQVAVDNDILIKASCLGAIPLFWAEPYDHVNILGAAKYVVRSRLTRQSLTHGSSKPLAQFEELLLRSVILEPTEDEIRLAARLESLAGLAGLSLDAGESQLAAIVSTRGFHALETGDKRGICALERLLDDVPELIALRGKVRCLEQLVKLVSRNQASFAALAESVCAEPSVDKALSICFQCRSTTPAPSEEALAGIESYIDDLRRSAPRLLMVIE